MTNGCKLPVPDFELSNFRAFDSLVIPRFGQVNLIVGKNNVGKSTLLGAIELWAGVRNSQTVWGIVERREESAGGRSPLLSLFHGRPTGGSGEPLLRIGPRADPLLVSLQLEPQPHLFFQRGDVGGQLLLERNRDTARILGLDPPASQPHVTLVGPAGVAPGVMANMWDHIVLSASESEVLEGLRLISPDVERVSFVGESAGPYPGVRRALAKLRGFNDPVPLRSLGDGVNRLLGLLLAAVHAKGGLLLIDEFENGLHYSVQQDVWRVMTEMASRLNVQIVATTHSSDCVAAFQRASAAQPEVEGVLTRLEVRGGRLRAIQFDEAELGIVTEDAIEVR